MHSSSSGGKKFLALFGKEGKGREEEEGDRRETTQFKIFMGGGS